MLRLIPMHAYMWGGIQYNKTHPHPPEGRSVAFLIPIHQGVVVFPSLSPPPSPWHPAGTGSSRGSPSQTEGEPEWGTNLQRAEETPSVPPDPPNGLADGSQGHRGAGSFATRRHTVRGDRDRDGRSAAK
jgi:hypothetical protein